MLIEPINMAQNNNKVANNMMRDLPLLAVCVLPSIRPARVLALVKIHCRL